MADRSLRVAALETEHVFGDAEGALSRLDEELSRIEDVDLVLLSECSLTGYVSQYGDFDLSRFAEPLDGPTTAELSQLALDHRIALASSFVERDGDDFYNAVVVHDAQGDRIAHYRKRHPWVPEVWATPGDRPLPLFDVRGVTLTIAVCFDVHFLEEESALELDQAEVLLFPSAWVNGPGPRDRRAAILPPLAKHHDLWIVNANWGRSLPRIAGQGCSKIVAPHGEVVAIADDAPAPHVVRFDIVLPEQPKSYLSR